jgi:hypothetical protein
MALAGHWEFFNLSGGYVVSLYGVSSGLDAIVMRFSSLPGCKLQGNASLTATWSNGFQEISMKSGYRPIGTPILTWADDGQSCALTGTKEKIAYETTAVAGSNTVKNLGSTAIPILTLR